MKRACLTLLSLVAFSLPALSLLAWAQLAWAQPAGKNSLGLDLSASDQTIPVPSANKDDPSVSLRCITYRRFMVKERHEGDDIGSASLTVVPVAGAPVPCSASKAAGEQDLQDNEGMSLMGAAGRFVMLIWPDGGNGGTSFAVFDSETARKLYSDTVKDSDDGFKSVTLDQSGGALELHYTRVVAGMCSLAGIQPDCWAQFLREAGLPGEMARRVPPYEACVAAYAQRKMTGKDLADPSVLAYDMVTRLDASGTSKLLSTGELSCWPAE